MVTHSGGRTDIFRAVSDPTRRAILDLLKLGSLPVGDIAAGFPVSRPAISKHLRVLRSAGVVLEGRSGRNRFYTLEPRALMALDAWLSSYRSLVRTSLARLKAHVEGTDEKYRRRRDR